MLTLPRGVDPGSMASGPWDSRPVSGGGGNETLILSIGGGLRADEFLKEGL